MDRVEAWHKIRYQHLPALRLAGQASWLHQNPGLIPGYQQKKHQKKRRWIIKKEVRSLQNNMDRYFDYSPTGDKGHTIIFLLTFEKLHNSTI
jgi:hypothetical protein